MASTSAQKLAHYHRQRKACIAALGGECVCCGEKEYDFLQIDHIYNDGAEHRRERKTKGGASLLIDVVKRGPERYQVLCANCHLAKSKNLICPHKR